MRRIFIMLIVVLGINAVTITSAFSQVGMWVEKQKMPTARYAMAAAVVDGNIYVIGGWGNNKFLETVEMQAYRKEISVLPLLLLMGRYMLSVDMMELMPSIQ
jgi:hypothetical protein